VANQFQNAVADFLLKNYPDGAKNAGMVYLNAGAAAENGKIQPQAMTKRGMRFVYQQGVDTTEFNYAPYVQGLKDAGAQHVQFLGGIPQYVRLAQTMQQQGFKPDVYVVDPTAYHPDYVEGAGSAGDGTVAFINFVPFEESSSSPELQLYLSWLDQTKPGATPDFFGLFAWSAARLFVEQAAKLGGKLNRESLVAALRGVDNWTANGLHSPQSVGPKRTGDCWRFVRLEGGKWSPVGGTKYTCSGLTVVN
jgi:ABC-type branched-subunit amino acid transport system substrate-binding protein